MSLWKMLLTFPYFLLIYNKAKRMTKKTLKDPNLVPEDHRYIWVQKKAKYICWIFNIKIKVSGLENWTKRKGCLLVANHQSNFDPIMILVLNDFTKFAPLAFIAKKELTKNKLIKAFGFLIDVLFIDRNNLRQTLQVFDEATKLIRTPRSMLIFPEGTRYKSSTMGEFKPGALKLAYQAYVPIIPISICNSYKITWKKRTNVHIVFHKPIPPEDFIMIKTTVLIKKIENIIQESIKNTNINHKS